MGFYMYLNKIFFSEELVVGLYTNALKLKNMGHIYFKLFLIDFKTIYLNKNENKITPQTSFAFYFFLT